MSQYRISQIYPSDRRSNRLINELLAAEGIRRDANLDYMCGMYDDEMNIIATGSTYCNTLRCLAVSSKHQGEGLMNDIVSHLVTNRMEKGYSHLFLYTKVDSARFFGDLGFYEIIRVDGQVVFMENKKTGFADYLDALAPCRQDKPRVSALVMNANPFTNGHLYLAEKAARESDLVHLFIVSEEMSLVPFAVRKQLIREGLAHLDNICLHDSGPYIISSATFPSYFQKDENAVIQSHAQLDLSIFTRIAGSLGITRRFVGDEPTSLVTGIYNNIMQQELPKAGIECTIIPRLEEGGRAISASTVRTALKEGDFDLLKTLVPPTTLAFFQSAAAEPVLKRIRESENVVHY